MLCENCVKFYLAESQRHNLRTLGLWRAANQPKVNTARTLSMTCSYDGHIYLNNKLINNTHTNVKQ